MKYCKTCRKTALVDDMHRIYYGDYCMGCLDKLPKDERPALTHKDKQLILAEQQLRMVTRIRNIADFFFWMTIASIVIGVIVLLANIS